MPINGAAVIAEVGIGRLDEPGSGLAMTPAAEPAAARRGMRWRRRTGPPCPTDHLRDLEVSLLVEVA